MFKKSYNLLIILIILLSNSINFSLAFATQVTFSANTTIALTSPVINLTVLAGSVADQITVNAGTLVVNMSATTGGTFVFTSPRVMTVGTSGSGGSVGQTCSGGVETDTITQSSASEVFTFIPTGPGCSGATAPDGPTGVSATPGNAQATVTFTASASNGGAAITGYTVTSSPAGGTDTNAGTTGLSHVVTGLTNGTAYTFTVTATNSVGTSAPSAPSTPVTPATVPNAPTGVSAVAGNAQATVTFSAPGFNGGSVITGYTVTSSPAGGTDTNAGTVGLSHTVTGLTNGTPYTFTVTATNAKGTSVASTASSQVTPTALTATTFTFTGPSSGNAGSSSGSFTITPDHSYTGTITIIPTGSASTGLSATVLTFSNSAVAQTFAITPNTAGSITLTPTNSGSLTNPANLTYTVTTSNVLGSGGLTSGGGSTLPSVITPPINTIPSVIVPGTVITSPTTRIIAGCNGNVGFSTTTGQSCAGNVVITTPTNPIIPPPIITTPPTSRIYNFGTTTLKNGSTGEAVKELQRFLNDKLNLGLVVDGKLGPKTILVIKQWQKDNGLVVDGLVGPKTKALMNGNFTITTPTNPINPPPTSRIYNFGTTTLKNGSTGEAVKELQRFLNDKLNSGLPVVGTFGPKTLAAVKEWQKENLLTVDGIVGPKTKALMNGSN